MFWDSLSLIHDTCVWGCTVLQRFCLNSLNVTPHTDFLTWVKFAVWCWLKSCKSKSIIVFHFLDYFHFPVSGNQHIYLHMLTHLRSGNKLQFFLTLKFTRFTVQWLGTCISSFKILCTLFLPHGNNGVTWSYPHTSFCLFFNIVLLGIWSTSSFCFMLADASFLYAMWCRTSTKRSACYHLSAN
jgi:hypothetical protein